MATENSNVIKAISIYGENEWQEPTPIGVDAENVFMNVDGKQKTLADFSENITSDNFLLKNKNEQTLTGNFGISGDLTVDGKVRSTKRVTIETTTTEGIEITNKGYNSSLGINYGNSLTTVTPYEPIYFGEKSSYSIPVGTIRSKTFQQQHQGYFNSRHAWPVFKANAYFPICGISNGACDSGIYLVTATIHLRGKSLINMPVTAYISPVNDLKNSIKNGTSIIKPTDRDSAAFSSTDWRREQDILLNGPGTQHRTIYSAFHSQRTVLGSTRNAVTQISLSTIYYFSTRQENRDFFLVLQNNNNTNYGYLTNFISTTDQQDKGDADPINANITVLKLF